jgi:hypothetical protein
MAATGQKVIKVGDTYQIEGYFTPTKTTVAFVNFNL